MKRLFTFMLTLTLILAILVSCGNSTANPQKDENGGYLTHTHTYRTKIVAPTCENQGYTLHTCTNCGKQYKDSYIAATDNHQYTETEVAATCTTKGYTLNTCSICGYSQKTEKDGYGSHIGTTKCSRCGVNYYTALSNMFKKIGVYTDKSYTYSMRYENLKFTWYLSDSGLLIDASNDSGHEFCFLMQNTNGMYAYQFSDGILKQSGQFNASTITDSTTHLSYTSTDCTGYFANMAESYSKMSANLLRLCVYMTELLLVSNDTSMTAEHLGFTKL